MSTFRPKAALLRHRQNQFYYSVSERVSTMKEYWMVYITVQLALDRLQKFLYNDIGIVQLRGAHDVASGSG